MQQLPLHQFRPYWPSTFPACEPPVQALTKFHLWLTTHGRRWPAARLDSAACRPPRRQLPIPFGTIRSLTSDRTHTNRKSLARNADNATLSNSIVLLASMVMIVSAPDVTAWVCSHVLKLLTVSPSEPRSITSSPVRK